MLKIFATFAFGVVGASAAPTLDTALFGLHVPTAVVSANGDGASPAQSNSGGSPGAASNGAFDKQHRLRKASKYEAADRFCECSDERVRAHCLIYMKLRGDKS